MAAPGAIEDLAASVVGKTSTTLTWANPADTDSVILRRAEGAEAPETSSDGEAVTVTGAVETVEDSGLDPDTQYSYAAWAVNAGSEESETAALLTVVTLPNTRPHNATSYSNPAWSSPAETAANNAQITLALQADFDRSEESSKEQYQDLTGLQEPVPTVSEIDPLTAVEGTGPVTVTVTGTGFIDESTVLWGETVLTPVVNSATELEVDVPDEVAGDYDLVVDNGESKLSTAAVFTYTAE